MKKQIVKRIGALALTLSIGVSSAALAQEKKPDTDQDGTTKKIETKKDCHRKHEKAHMMNGRVFEKMGIKKEDVQKAKQTGKTMFDLAKEKGYTEAQVKEMIVKDRTEAINKAVENGKLTREEADTKILKVKEKISKWDGTIKDHKEEKHKSEQN
jgi:hypothetical protein